jgi:DNA-binding response OmpR family regulator
MMMPLPRGTAPPASQVPAAVRPARPFTGGNEAMTSQESARATVTHPPGDISRVRILVADHEPGIRASVGRALDVAGYLPDLAATGPEALRRALGGHYDLIILDLVMPGMTGQEVLERLLAARPYQAVVVLSGLADVAVKVKCLEHGAQDYLTKPFSLAELLARVRLRVRPRGGTADSGRGGTADSGRAAGIVRAGSLTLDVGRLAADTGDGAVPLTRLEFLLLRELAEHAGQPVPKGRLLASVWGYNFDPGSNVVDVCVRRLRSKLGFELIKTVRGEGYQLADGLMARRIVDRLVKPGCDRRPPAVTGQQTSAGAAREVRRTAARHQIPPAPRRLRRAAVYDANHRAAKGLGQRDRVNMRNWQALALGHPNRRNFLNNGLQSASDPLLRARRPGYAVRRVAFRHQVGRIRRRSPREVSNPGM